MKKLMPWLKILKKSDPEPQIDTPVWLDGWSNGEVFVPQTARDRKIKKRILELADENARRVGVDRRSFLASAMGMATSLTVMGCSDDEGDPNPGGQNCNPLPTEAMFDEQCAIGALGGDEFIFDIQTHHYVRGDWERTNPSYRTFFNAVGWYDRNRDEYIQRIYLESQTHVTVLSGLPAPECSETLKVACGLPISNEEIATSRDIVNEMSGSIRMLNHSMVVPNVANIGEQLAVMEQNACKYGACGWKLYPGFTGTIASGYFLDSQEYGLPVIEKGIALGVPIFCIHKGLPIGNFFDVEHNQPRDVGVVAKKYPNAKFIIYHSAICAGIATSGPGCAEGPYDPADPNPTGTNQLIRSLEENEIGPGGNVYGELGTALGMAFGGGNENAGHFLGKLLKYLGEDNVCWGTDAMNGLRSPQPIIEQFRAFQIPDNLVQQYGYPQLTPEIKKKIFGLNSARIFGIDPNKARCAIENEPLTRLQRNLDGEFGGRRWTMLNPPGPTTRRDFLRFRKSLNGMPG